MTWQESEQICRSLEAAFNELPFVGVRWIGPDGTDVLLVPTSVSLDGTQIIVTIPGYLITQLGIANVYVINNPTANDPAEIAGPLTIEILPYTLYFPVMHDNQ